MIKTIIFDFGDVFINLDKSATIREFSKLGEIKFTLDIQEINNLYEVGKISTSAFTKKYQELLPGTSAKEIIKAWNSILLDFPKHRLEFLQKLASEQEYKLILLSNTNELHINWIKENISFFKTFKSCFDAFYLSHEIHLRKPKADIFEYVLQQHKIRPTETLFIDDTKENTVAASKLGIHTWNNNPKTEDITNLFTIKPDLF